METVTFRVRSLVWFATGVVVTLLATLVVLQAWRVDAAPGDLDSTLVPITPCRLIDTRQPGEPALGAGETRTITALGTNGPIPGSQCTIPADAVGLSMNVTAVDATAPTFWTIWPDGTAMPVVSSLNPTPGQPPTPNAVTTPISPAGKFNVFNLAGTVSMLIDINGYYTNTSLQSLKAAQPFAVTARDEAETVTKTDEVVVSVQVMAPVAGQVTVNSATTAHESTAGSGVRCSIRTTGFIIAQDFDYLQIFESAGSSGDTSPMSGTRVFDIAAGETATYRLVCDTFGASPNSSVEDSVLTAIFTPAL